MFHRWAALVLVLALCAMSPKNAAGQTQSPREPGAGKLGRPFPNPFNPEVRIPFSIGLNDAGVCTDEHLVRVVSIRILNILAQQIAVPIFEDLSTSSTAGGTNPLGGSVLANLKLSCGSFQAFWNGKLQNTTNEAASGTYVVQFFLDGKLADSKRIFYRK
jgi:hypothetical protein